LEVGLDGSTRMVSRDTGSVCDQPDCFRAALRDRAHSSGTVIMAVTNAGFAAFWHNLRCSLERVGAGQHALIIGTDRDACSAALAPGVSCLVGESLFWPEEAAAELQRKAVSHGTRPYARLMQVKARPTLQALRLGYSVLSTDTDIVFLRNPLPHLEALQHDGEVDVLIQSDHDEVNDAACARHEECPRSFWCEEGGRCAEEVCGGLHWMRGGAPQATALLERMFALFEQQRRNGDERTGEQPALNHAIRRTPGLRYRLLPRGLYPNGAAFFSRGLRPPADEPLPYAIHNNWISGFEVRRGALSGLGARARLMWPLPRRQAKRSRFEQHALWLTRYTTEGAPTACITTALHAPT
jgi:hypothetical protein